MLSEIVQLVNAPAITLPVIMRLQDIIEDYMTNRAALFPDIAMKPKHHYLLHYSYPMTQSGPLVRMWTLRCESKHGYFRKRARSCQNFKNLTKTLAERHQLYQAYKNVGSNTDGLCNASSFLYELCSPEIQKEVCAVISDKKNLSSAKQATIQGLFYKREMLVALYHTNGCLVFGEIQFILFSREGHFLLLRTVKTEYEAGMQYFNIV